MQPMPQASRLTLLHRRRQEVKRTIARVDRAIAQLERRLAVLFIQTLRQVA